MPSDPPASTTRTRPSFRTTLTRVLAVQVATLILLWILQSLYHA